MWRHRDLPLLTLLLAVPTIGCGVDLGTCDEAAARTVVFDELGLPAYAGQAQMRMACGNGSFCHSAQADGRSRLGAPGELDFDMTLAATDVSAQPDATARLGRGAANVRDYAESIFGEVDGDTMPPFGETTLLAHAGVPRYRFEDGRRLPQVDIIEGNEILRNWLACGAPIVERTTPHPDGVVPVGDVVAGRDVGVEATFTDIWTRFIGPRCGSVCHGPNGPDELEASQLDLSTQAGAYMALVGTAAAGVSCMSTGTLRVAPGDPDASLIVQKLDPQPGLCGDPMPPGEAPPAELLTTIREWILAGAMDN